MKHPTRQKENGPRAIAAARKAKVVAIGKQTQLYYPKPSRYASTYDRGRVVRRCPIRSRWADLIAKLTGLRGRA